MRTLGCTWVLVALVLNQWVLARLLSVQGFGPRSRILLAVVDLGLLGWGYVTVRYRRSLRVQKLNLLLVTLGLLALGLELLLHARPEVLSREFANGVQNPYHTGPGGIYYTDPLARMVFMIPNHRTEITFNGYQWRHETDAFGFRNHETRTRADVVLLGDSWIYGHGVDIDGTVAHFLETLTPLKVANLGRQGAAALEEAAFLTYHIDRLRPRYVVYFFFNNDIQDLFSIHATRTRQELTVFADTPVGEIRFPTPMPVQEALGRRAERLAARPAAESLSDALRARLYTLRMLDWLRYRREQASAEAEFRVLGEDIDDANSLGWRVTKKAIMYMVNLSRQRGARLIMAPITVANPRYHLILRDFAKREGIDFVETWPLMADPKGPLFLPADGHFSPKGAEAMARTVGDYLLRLEGAQGFGGVKPSSSFKPPHAGAAAARALNLPRFVRHPGSYESG